ncbi:UDP-N-acetylglucosamine 1-carboxyvinyltransferase [Gammaproteobacteria bacterium]|nr:UDP-N-acetylglucosamine 1-carboxyvinyltransferase [Gammaproteobacteria bacterium]
MDCVDLSPVKQIEGHIVANGAKNSVLLLMAASVLAKKHVVLTRVPKIKDVEMMCLLLNSLSIKTSYLSSDVLLIDATYAAYADLTGYECQEVRTSLLFLGGMLGRFGKVKLRTPGGCNLGKRPIDFHLNAMKMMGAEVQVKDGVIHAKSLNQGDCVVDFPKSTVTGTANAILAAVNRQGETHIHGAVLEPEIDDLIAFLSKLGVDIRRLGILIVINGGVETRSIEHAVMADRIEVGTYLIATAIIGGKLKVSGVNPGVLSEVLRNLKLVGAKIETTENSIEIEMTQRPKAIDIITGPYPAFPTDLQPQWSVLSAVSEGVSCIQDQIYKQRIDHFEELNKMGANCQASPGGAVITGVDQLYGAKVVARSLRSAAAMALAGLKAEGITKVLNISYLYRGYEGFFDKIKCIEK